jgi:hypothetical protein
VSLYIDTTHPRYDPRIAAAFVRTAVYLADGRSATLICWQRNGDRAKVHVEGRHQWVPKDDIIWITDPTGTP